MNPDQKRQQAESVERRIEEANQPGSFLDSIRALAHRTHTKVLVLATLVGLSGTAACEMPNEKDKTEQSNNNNNQNEVYQGCEPFSRCQMMELIDEDTRDVVGFSLWYDVPDGEEFDDVKFEVVDLGGETIGEESVFLPSGTGEYWITEPGYDGDLITEKASIISHVNIIFPDGETIVTIQNGALLHPDDDAPPIGQ